MDSTGFFTLCNDCLQSIALADSCFMLSQLPDIIRRGIHRKSPKTYFAPASKNKIQRGWGMRPGTQKNPCRQTKNGFYFNVVFCFGPATNFGLSMGERLDLIRRK